MTPEITRSECDIIERLLEAPAGSALLDVPCGHGRHAVELAKRGYKLTGVDGSAESLELARMENAQIQWRESDMRDLPWSRAFDGAYCWGNSFGYLEKGGVRAFVAALGRALKSGARVVIDTGVAAESILPTLLPGRWHRMGDIFMLSKASYVPEHSRLDIEYTFVQGGSIETKPAASYILRAAEIRELLEEAGFGNVRLLTGDGTEPYRLGSPRLIVAAQRE